VHCSGGEGEKNEYAAVGEKGRRMLCGRLGQRFQKGGAVRAKRGNLLFIGVRWRGFGGAVY